MRKVTKKKAVNGLLCSMLSVSLLLPTTIGATGLAPEDNSPQDAASTVTSVTSTSTGITVETITGITNPGWDQDGTYAYANNSIYELGGITTFDTGTGSTSEIRRYDPAQKTWVLEGDLYRHRYQGKSVAIGKKIYTIGGNFWVYDEPYFEGTFEVFDIETGESTELPTAPLTLFYNEIYTPVVIRDKIYVKDDTQNSADMAVYDIQANQWTSLTGLSNVQTVANGQTLYGVKHDGRIYAYDIAQDSWSLARNLDRHIYGESMFMIGDTLYYAGSSEPLCSVNVATGEEKVYEGIFITSPVLVGSNGTVYTFPSETTMQILHIPQANAGQEWNFDQDGDLEGWKAQKHLSDVTVANGVLSAKSTGGDPILENNNVTLDADSIHYLAVRVKNSTPSTVVRFYWRNNAMSGHTNEASVMNENMVANYEPYQYFFFDVSNKADWTGIITNLRLDPVNAAGNFEIDFVEAIAYGSDREKAYESYGDIKVRYAGGEGTDRVTQDLYLYSNYYGVPVVWSSDHPDIIDSTGKVTRPENWEDDVVVTLTAAIGPTPYYKQFSMKVVKKVICDFYEWDFEHVTKVDWLPVRDIEEVSYIAGGQPFYCLTTGPDPIIQNRSNRLYNADVIDTLIISGLRISHEHQLDETTNDRFEFYWQYPGDTTHDIYKKIDFDVRAGQTEYTINLKENPNWKGLVANLRIDPTYRRYENMVVRMDKITLCSSNGNTMELTMDENGTVSLPLENSTSLSEENSADQNAASQNNCSNQDTTAAPVSEGNSIADVILPDDSAPIDASDDNQEEDENNNLLPEDEIDSSQS